MPDEPPYYDPETCRFVNGDDSDSTVVRETLKWGLLSLMLTCLAFGGVVYLSGSPSELWLAFRNERLADQLLQVRARMNEYAVRIDDLSARDRELYRTLLQARDIPEPALQMGTGGALSSASYEYEGAHSHELVSTTAQAADSIARQISLQRESYRHLLRLVDRFEERMPQEPAILPANGPVISGYGMRYHPIYRRSRMHRGIDIRTETGTPVYATGTGRIISAGRDGGYGLCVRVKHPATGHETRYAHLSSIPDSLESGMRVARGEVIGYSGNTGLSTGPHLHYEVRDADGESLNPVHFFLPEMTPQHYHTRRARASYAAADLDSLAG